MYALSLMVAAFLTINGVAIATNCWQINGTLHYNVGPDVVPLQQSEANKIMNEVLNHVKTKLTCSGLSLTLIKVTIATPGNKYAIKGTFGVNYGSMDSSQKQTAYRCLGLLQIFSDIIRNPEQYTSPIANNYWVDRSSVSNLIDTICCTSGLVLVNSVCVPPSLSLLSSMNSSQTISIYPLNATMSSVSAILNISSSPTANTTSASPYTSSTAIPTTSDTIVTSSTIPATSSASPYTSSTAIPTTSSNSSILIQITPTASTSDKIVMTSTSSTIPGTSSASPYATPSSTAIPTTSITSPSPTAAPTDVITTASPWFPVLRCYRMHLTLLYNISQDLSISKLNPSFLKYTIIVITNGFLQSIASCNSVKSSLDSTILSRIDNSTVVAVRVVLKFSVKSKTPDNDLERTLTTCLGNLQQSTYTSLLQNSSIQLTVIGLILHEKHSVQVHPAVSCCGDGAKLPCCPGNSIKKSKTRCAPLYFDDYIQNKEVRLGGTVVASCAVRTGAEVKISWKRNNKNFPSRVSAFNYTLIINDVGTSDAGIYQCVVHNDFQVITKPFYLKVVVSQEVEMRLTLGETFHPDLLNKTSEIYKFLRQYFIMQIEAVLSKTLKEFEKIEVLLFTKGSVIVDFKVYLQKTITSPISSPPNLKSEAISVMINQAQQGSFGNLTVNSLVLKVKPPPPLNIKVSDRGPTYITLAWQPPPGWKSYEITSYIVRYRIDNQLHWKTIDVTDDKNSLKIRSLNANTKYQFQMVSRSTLGDGKPSLLLDVTTLTVHPIIANNGQTFTATVGQTVVLVCRGSSNPRPEKVTWTRKAPSAEFYTNITGNDKILNRYMVIHNVSVDDSGSYGCSASYKDVTNKGAVNLIVNVPVAINMNITLTKMDFTEDLKNTSSSEFQNLSRRFVSTVSQLYEHVTGFKEIVVLAFEEGSVKVSFRVIIVVKIEKPKAKVKQSEAKANATNIIIKRVVKNDGQLGGGLTVQKDSLQTDAPPNPPSNVTVIDIKETTAHLAWAKPEYAELFSVTHYTIKLKKHGDQFTWDEKVTTSYVQLDCPLENLQEGTGYNVKVLAKSGGRYGLESKQEEFTTKDLKTSLVWLWILISIVVVLAIVIIGILWYRYHLNREEDDSHDSNAINTEMYESDIRLNSYKNLDFAESSPEFSSLGIMPGKWWEISRTSLTLEEELGSGAFGLVRKAQLNTGDRNVTCAVKMLKKMASDEEECDLVKELEIMGGVGSHANLVNLIGACTHNGPLLIVLEFAEKGCLLDYLKLNVTKVNGDQVCSLADEVKLNIGVDIANGMQHLANVKCVHRDLAARNVLLTGHGQAKISDFGLSRDVYERGFYEKTTKGKLPVRWMAPEAITKMVFTTKSDVWSYGVVLWEIETGGKMPYAGVVGLELVQHLKKEYRLERPGSCKDDVYNIMVHCWHINPNERPTFDVLCLKMEALI